MHAGDGMKVIYTAWFAFKRELYVSFTPGLVAYSNNRW